MTEDRAEKIKLDTNEFDVLLGRGNNVNYRPGNICFRNLAAERALEYTSTDRKERKDNLAQEIIASVKEKGGRFLRSVTASNAKGDHIAAWEIVDDDVVLTKAKQAMRDAASSMKDKTKRGNETTSSNLPGFERSQTREHIGVFSGPEQGEANVNLYLRQPAVQQSLGTATHPEHFLATLGAQDGLGPSILHRFNAGDVGQQPHFANFGGRSNDYLSLMLQHQQREEIAQLQRQYIQSQLGSNLYPHGMIGPMNADRNVSNELPVPDPAAAMRSQVPQSLPEINPGSTAKRMRDSADIRSSDSNTTESKRSRTMDQSSFYEQSKSTTTVGGSSRQSLYPKHPMSLPMEPFSVTHLHSMATPDRPLLHPAEQRRTSHQGIGINHGSVQPVYPSKSSEDSSSSDGSQKKPKGKP